MRDFFDPTRSSEVLIPTNGTLHLISVVILLLLVLLVIWRKKEVQRLVANRKFLIWFMIIFLAFEALSTILLWSYKFEPKWERIPLHLCYTMSVTIPVLILLKKYDAVKFFSYWIICSGFIAIANPSFQHHVPWSFDFIHYLVRHYFLFLVPMVFQIGLGWKHNYRTFAYSMATLASYAFIIFLANWATGANYMHLGQNNPTAITFLPESFVKWPYSYPSFVGVGIVMLHIAYFTFPRLGRKMLRAEAVGAEK